MLSPPEGLIIRESKPGDIGYIAYMHTKYYCTKYDFFANREYFFMKPIADFAKDTENSKLWMAEVDGAIVGSVAILRIDETTAQFRFFLVEEQFQGMGIGSKLLNISLDYCREIGAKTVFLWTAAGLDVARQLYEKVGFVLTDEFPSESSDGLIEQRFEMKM